jgi:CheY-like chemotaxis protein
MLSVLIADDDTDIRESLAEWLVTWGADVTQARDGLEAIELINQRKIDLVVTDLIMPEVEGLEMIQWVRTYAPHVKVFAMSGYGSITNTTIYLSMAKKFGAEAILQKPFRLPDLNLLVEKHFGSALLAAVTTGHEKPAEDAQRASGEFAQVG